MSREQIFHHQTSMKSKILIQEHRDFGIQVDGKVNVNKR